MQGSNTVRAGAETRAKRHYGGGVLRLVPPRRPEGTSEAGERKERAIDPAVAGQWLACAADRLQKESERHDARVFFGSLPRDVDTVAFHNHEVMPCESFDVRDWFDDCTLFKVSSHLLAT